MTWLFIGLVVLVVAAVAVVAVGRGAGLSVAQPDRPEVAVPADRMLGGADLDAIGLTVGLRGYRMDEVDDLLSRLATEIDERDRRLAELAPPPAGAEASGPVTAEQPFPGQSAAAQPLPGQPAAAQSAAGHSAAGQSAAGQSAAGQSDPVDAADLDPIAEPEPSELR